jgi:hypothetical protein
MRSSSMKLNLFVVLIIVSTTCLRGQTTALDSLITKVELKDGSSLIGTLISEDSLGVDFRTLGGVTARITHTQIRYKFPYKESAGTPKDSMQRKMIIDPNRSRLFLMPTARPIGSGNGYFSAYEIFFPTLAFGLGNNVSLAGGMSIFPGSSDQLLYFAPKVTLLNSSTLSLAVGGLYIGTGGNNDGTSMFYGAVTLGNEKSSLTIAARIPTEQDQNSLFVIGGELQTSSSVKFITENWIYSNSILYSFGIRFFGEKLSADLGFVRAGESYGGNGFPFLPWLGFSYNFGTPSAVSQETEKTQQFSPSTYRARFSYGLLTTSGNDELQKSLENQGFNSPEYYSGLFSSENENNTNGNGVLIQLERSFGDIFAAGITLSSIGEILGGSASLAANRYYQMPTYLNANITVDHSILTYGAHISYVSPATENRDRSYSFGAGIGNSNLTTDWSFRDYYYYSSATTHKIFSASQLTGFAFLAVQQHITQVISIGIDGSYFFMADTKIDGFDLGSITYKDYSTNPATDRLQTISIGTMTPNFGYGKLGISMGLSF